MQMIGLFQVFVAPYPCSYLAKIEGILFFRKKECWSEKFNKLTFLTAEASR